jgi:hypothetical protein
MRFFHGFSGFSPATVPCDTVQARKASMPQGRGSQGREIPSRRAFWRRCQRSLLASLLTGKQAVLTAAGPSSAGEKSLYGIKIFLWVCTMLRGR